MIQSDQFSCHPYFYVPIQKEKIDFHCLVIYAMLAQTLDHKLGGYKMGLDFLSHLIIFFNNYIMLNDAVDKEFMIGIKTAGLNLVPKRIC